MAEITLTSENFENEVLKSEIPVLVDFWASWCGPCRMLAPAVAEIAEEQEGKIKVGKVNVDDEEELAVKFGISSIPTLLVFRNGAPAGRSVGLIPKSSVEKLLGL